MIPLNIISKLARSRSHVLLTRSFVTTGSQLQKVGCGPMDGNEKTPKCEEKQKQKKSSCAGGEHGILEKKKQGEGHASLKKECPAPKRPEKSSKAMPVHGDKKKEKDHSKFGKSRGCSCPPYSTPKQKETHSNKQSCSEPKKQSCSEAERKGSDPCVSKKESPHEKSKCGPQTKHDHCPSTKKKSTSKDRCGAQHHKDPCEKKEHSRKSSCSKRGSKGPYGKGMLSYKNKCDHKPPCEEKSSKPSCPETCEEKKDPCEPKCPQQDPCEPKCPEQDPCEPKCQEECPKPECPKVENKCDDPCKKQFELNPCGKKNDCHEAKEEVRCEKEKKCEEPCPIEVKVPQLSPCCESEAAKECLCKLKELQKQWEEVIAAQKKVKMECSEKSPPTCQKKASSTCEKDPKQLHCHKRSNMIYVMLSAILGAVIYYIYNGDFEPEKLFLEEEEENNDDDDDED